MTRKEKYLAAMEDQYNSIDGMCLCIARQFQIPNRGSWADLWPKVPEFILFHPDGNASCWGWFIDDRANKARIPPDSLRQTILAFCVAMASTK